MEFKKITKDDELHSAVVSVLNDTSDDRTDYNVVAKAYNDLEPGDVVAFAFPKAKFPSLLKQIEKRGLIRGVDFQAKNVLDGADETNPGTETTVLRRITPKAAEILVITVPNRRKRGSATADAATEASAPAVAPATAAAPAAPAPIGKAAGPKAGKK